MSKKPTICLGLICKNEAHCIMNLLESVYKYIDYWVICDTGSTDTTREIIKEFFKSKNIPGELYIDEFKDIGFNKTLMLDRAYGKSDYLLHIDADDKLVGEFVFTEEDEGFDCYLLNTKSPRHQDWKSILLFKNTIKWVLAGVAHTLVVRLDNNTFKIGDLSNKNYYISFEAKGARNFDPKKFQKDAEKLEKQFYDTIVSDPYGINSRSVFYAAQSHGDYQNWEECLKWNKLYQRLKDTWEEEVFESKLRAASCMIALGYPTQTILQEFLSAYNMYNDRAEPLHYIARYLFDLGDYTASYDYYRKALEKNLDEVKIKYILFINELSYGKNLYYPLIKCCEKLGFFDEALKYIEILLSNPELVSSEEILDIKKNILSNIKTTPKTKLSGASTPIKNFKKI